MEEALPFIAKMLCELHTESKKPYELEFGYVSDATDHQFVRVDNPKRFVRIHCLIGRDELVQRAVNAIREDEAGSDGGMEVEN